MSYETTDTMVEVGMLTTFLADEEVRALAKNERFRKYVLSQKKVLSSLLKNSFELFDDSGITLELKVDSNSTKEKPVQVYKPGLKAELVKNEVLKTAVVQVEREIPVSGGNSQLKSKVDPNVILQEVTQIFAEKTGYPADMLEPKLDLEADLGVDTVKQMEILGLIRKKYNLELKEGFSLKQTPSISAVVEMILTSK